MPKLAVGYRAHVKPVARWVWTLFIAMLVPLVPFAMIGELPGQAWLSSQDEHAVGFGLTGAALLAGDLLLPIPSSIIGSMLGARLGFVVGGLCTFGGLFSGHMLGYGVGRLFGRRPQANDSPLAGRVTALWVFGSRPVPVLAEALTLAAGANRLNVWHFAAACAAGDALYAAAMAGNGAALLPGALLGPGLILPMLLPVVAYTGYRWLTRGD